MGAISNILDGKSVSCHDLPPKEMIFGASEGMRGLLKIVEQVATASVPIVILGEKGTGKETLARFIHSCSPGANAPFLKLSPPFRSGCAMDEVAFRLEDSLVGSQDSFPCERDLEGPPCTLFVEEVSGVSQDRQLELLKLIRGCRPLISMDGADIPVEFRVIGTSTQDLDQEAAAGRLREDLYSLLSVVRLRLSPLRERKEDIPQLAYYFWQVYSDRFGCQSPAPGLQLVRRLQEHDWPGNIRELENVLKRYVVLGVEGIGDIGSSSQLQRPVALAPQARRFVSLKQVTREATQALERKIILRTLQETQWNRRQTARALKISYRALLYKIKEAGLLPEQTRDEVDLSGATSQKPDRRVA
jgi:two-component system response regulator AtoC